MNIYTVVIMANKYMNNGEKDYSQEYAAYAQEEDKYNNPCALAYDENNKVGNDFAFHVYEKCVKSETGLGAIMKFWKWRAEGLDEQYLFGESY